MAAPESWSVSEWAVFAICEVFSLPFSFDGVERWRAHDESHSSFVGYCSLSDAIWDSVSLAKEKTC